MEYTQIITQADVQAQRICSWVFAGQKMTAKQRHWYENSSEAERQRHLAAQTQACAQRGITIVTRLDAAYPASWQTNAHAPDIIYAKGDVNLLQQSCLSVVGSRQPNPYSQLVASQICRQASAQNWTLVSGLAQGIDSLAHEVAIQTRGATIAVLAFGHDYCYPTSQWHRNAKQYLEQHQLVISQYPPHTPIARWRFIERNFLIATLSPALVVVQAKAKSGSLITAEMALEAGSDVYIATGIFGDPDYDGGHELVGEGAIALQNFNQILQTYDKF